MRGIDNGVVVPRLFARDDFVNLATDLDHSVTESARVEESKVSTRERRMIQTERNEPINISHSFRFSRLDLVEQGEVGLVW